MAANYSSNLRNWQACRGIFKPSAASGLHTVVRESACGKQRTFAGPHAQFDFPILPVAVHGMADVHELFEPNKQPAAAAHESEAGYAPGGVLRGQLLGPYLLLDRLGGGAMATVYRALDQRNGHAVAIKVLRPDADAVMRERFRREAETHSNLNHPNIVQILDVGQVSDSGLTYIAMELIEGPNLSEVMEETGRLSPIDAARILQPVAAALDYSCRQGVIHRDVKPSNVLLRRVHIGTPNAVEIAGLDMPVLPLLSDFGIARALDAPELTSAGRTIGTPTYMSPEQCADSHEIDGRSDLYSLGAVFYRCVVGRPPFTGTTTQILHAHVYDPLTIPDDVLDDLPPAAVTLLRRTLAKDPNLRYADGGELAADLQQLLNSPWPPPAATAAGEATATMPVLDTLPATTAPGSQTVLVPAPEAGTAPAAGQPATPAALVAAAGAPAFIPVETTLPRVVTTMAAAPPRRRRRWLGAVMGGVLAAAVLIFGGGLALNLLPTELVGSMPPAPSPTAPAAAADTSVAAPVPSAAPLAGQTADAAGTDAGNSQSAAPALTAPAATPAAAAQLPTLPPPTPAGDIRSYWSEAEAAYQDGDWQSALEFLTLARRIDPGYQDEVGDQILFESQIGLAANGIARGELEQSLEHWDAALALRPDAGRVKSIALALRALVAPGTLNIAMARWTLATALGSYAQELLAAERACAAAEQLQAAVTLSPVESSAKLLAETQATCEQARRAAEMQRRLAGLSGRLLYSTQDGGSYRIYRAEAKLDAASSLLIDNGSQPSRQRLGAVVAFHSRQADTPGLSLFDLSSGLTPDGRTLRLTTAAGDGQDAPPSWSPTDRTLVYAGVADDRSRIYRVDAADGATPVDLGPGRDPAWSPDQDRMVFNGVNEQGGEPGLWLMNSDGGNRLRLTDNGNDMRPVWTPDGLAIVFMSSRDGNWEVYRLDLLTGDLSRLTTDPAQDGLPTVSPDGKWVAFASDRGGYWRIWVTPLAGGEAQPLLKIEAVLTNWLEHAIQWIP